MAFLAALLLVTTAFRCDALHEFLNPYQLPARGLSATPGDPAETPGLLWTLNVGLLNDSEFPELSVADVDPILEEVATRLKALLPGVEVRFLIDQPMNSVFLIERSVRKKGFLAPKYNADATVLLLGSGAATAESNRQRLLNVAGLTPAAADRELTQMQALTAAGCLAEKLPASDYVWRAYLAGQVRYDLVLTNALIYADDLPHRAAEDRPTYWNPDLHVVRRALAPMGGRSALEGYGAYVSLYDNSRDNRESPDSGRGSDESGNSPARECPDFTNEMRVASHADVLVGTVFELLYPARLPVTLNARAPETFLNACGARCDAYWTTRYAYLKTMIDLEQGGGEPACERLETHYTDYARDSTLSAERTAQYVRNHTKFRRLCGKNR